MDPKENFEKSKFSNENFAKISSGNRIDAKFSKISMRDAFIGKLYDIGLNDKNLIFVSGDMGAPALDDFRKDLSSQFVNVGIAEHNMVAVASGLALEGKKTYCFAIAPFASSRCYEFTKIDLSLMKIPVTILGVGAGFGYDDSGPTHHTTEDISIMRALPNMEIYCPADSMSASKVAELTYKSGKPGYVRLDRQLQPLIYSEDESFEEGFKELRTGDEIGIIATGNMVHIALDAAEKLREKGKNVGVVDLYRIKPVNPFLKDVLGRYKYVISLEEHLLDGGLGSLISEIITDDNLDVKLKRLGVKEYLYKYGRDHIQECCGIDADSVVRFVERWC